MISMMPATTSGLKRHAPDDLDYEQRLTKRLDLLEIRRRHPASQPDENPLTHGIEQNARKRKTAESSSAPTVASQPSASTSTSTKEDSMDVEDTKHRVYIHDVDAELSEPESDSEHPIYLSDIEKHLMKIPRHILIDDNSKKAAEGMQLVLYGAPTSLTVPESNDSVRRAIIESRQRARNLQPFTVPDKEAAFPVSTQALAATDDYSNDPDAMDIG